MLLSLGGRREPVTPAFRPLHLCGLGERGARRLGVKVMTREEWIAGLREHAGIWGIYVTDDLLKTANLIYDAFEEWKAAGFTDREALSELLAWLNGSEDDLSRLN